MIVALTLITALVGGIMIYRSIDDKYVFDEGGYVFTGMEEQEDGGYVTDITRFTAGTQYSVNRTEQLRFTDADNKKVSLETPSFIHYDSGAVSASTSGVVMDIYNLTKGGLSAYNVAGGTVMTASGEGYSVEHMGEARVFRDLLWKISTDRYLVLSRNLRLELANGEEHTFKDLVEVNYVDHGVIQIITQEQTLMTVSPVCLLTTAGGTEIDFANGVLRGEGIEFPLDQMIVNANDNIDLTSIGEEKNPIHIPTFRVIDGKDGEDGEEGEEGVVGDDGTQGEEGTYGEDGMEGEEGATGAAGITPESPDSSSQNNNGGSLPKFTMPQFHLSEYKVTAISVSGRIQIEDKESLVVDGSVVLRIIDSRTGQEVYREDNFGGRMDFSFAYSELVSGQEYDLIISADYMVEGSTFSKEFVKKHIVADSVGVSATVKETTSDSITVNAYKEPYSGATSLIVRLYDANGNLHEEKMAPTLVPGDNLFVFTGLTPDTKYTVKVEDVVCDYDGTALVIPMHHSEDCKTLRVLAGLTLGAPNTFASVANRSISVWPGLIDGIDLNGIELYRYEFYNISAFEANGDLKAGATPVRVFNANTSKTVIAPVTSAGSTSSSVLRWNAFYKVRLVIEFYDNQKIVEKASPFTGSVGVSGTQFPIVTYEPNAAWNASATNEYDRIAGHLIIDTNGADLKIDSTNPLILAFENSQNGHTYNVNWTSWTTSDQSGGPISPITDGSGNTGSNGSGIFKVPVYADGLQSDVPYNMSVWATINFYRSPADPAPTEEKLCLNTLSVQPGKMDVFGVKLINQAPGVHAFSVDLSLTDYAGESMPDNLLYQSNNMMVISLALYEGTYAEDKTPIATTNITSSNSNHSESTIGAYYDGHKTAADVADFAGPAHIVSGAPGGQPNTYGFGLADGQLDPSSLYTLVVTDVADYTVNRSSTRQYFVNKFPTKSADSGMLGGFGKSLIALEIYPSDAAPALPSFGGAFDVTTITEGNAKNFLPVSHPGGSLRPGYNSNTVVGFAAQSTFSMPGMAESFTYTLWRTKQHNVSQLVSAEELLAPDDSPAGEQVGQWVLPVNAGPDNVKRIPTLVVAFGSSEPEVLPGGQATSSTTTFVAQLGGNENDARGYHYYFTYTANLSTALGGSYTYPQDYPGYVTAPYEGKYPLHSERISAPLQQPAFKMYPKSSDAASEIWSYVLNDIDQTLTGGSLTVESGDRTQNISGLVVSSTSALNSFANTMEFKPAGGLYPAESYTVTYKEKLWRYADSQAVDPVAHPVETSQTLMTRYHRSAWTQADASGRVGEFSLYYHQDVNRIYVAFEDLADADLARLAGVHLTVSSGPKQVTYWLPLEKNAPDPTRPGTQAISCFVSVPVLGQTFAQNDTLTFKPVVYYDSGLIDFDAATVGAAFALQTQESDQDGKYLLPTQTPGNFNYQSFSGKAVYQPLSHNATNGTLAYANLFTPAFQGSVALQYDGQGAKISNTTRYVVPKLLQEFTAPGSGGGNTLSMPAVLPEVSDMGIVPGITGAQISFNLWGLQSLAQGKVELHIQKDSTGTPMPVQIISFTNEDHMTAGLNLTGLEPNTQYSFYIKGYMGSTLTGLYDRDKQQTAYRYIFTTIDNIDFGEANTFKAVYEATDYENKMIRLDYTMSLERGFYIKYKILDVTTGVEKIISSQTPNYRRNMVDYLPVGKQVDSLKDFLVTGHNYELQVLAYSNTDNSLLGKSGEIGTAASYKFTYRTLVPATFSMVATPEDDGTGAKINIRIARSDPDQIVVNGQYLVRVLNGAGFVIHNQVYDASNGSIVGISLSGPNIQPGSTYSIEVYAVNDERNSFTLGNISTIAEQDLPQYLQTAGTVTTLVANQVVVGQVTAVSAGTDGVRLQFENSIHLATDGQNPNQPYKIKYSVINMNDGTSPIATTSSAFAPQDAGGYLYFVLNGTVPNPGQYLVTYQLYYQDGTQIPNGRGTIIYRKV